MSAFVKSLDARFYPSEHGAWDNKRFRELLLPIVRLEHRILDLGAGRGRVPEMNFRGLAREVVGIDPDPCVRENPFLDRAVVADDPRAPLPFDDASFDVVITCNVLEHVSDPAALFAEVRRVLRPGGWFISKTPNRGHYVALIASVTPHRFHEWVNERRGRASADTYPTYYRANSRGAVRALAEGAGFAVELATTWEGPPNYLRILPPAYPLGIVYERLVNSSPALEGLRAVLVSILRNSDS